MAHSSRVLIVYYSLTHQTEMVIRIYREELERAGHVVDVRRIQPSQEWTIPFPKPRFFHLWLDMMWLGIEKTQPIEPMEFPAAGYDVIILGFQPWNLLPSIPVNSFLESPMARILNGARVVCVMTCRGSWERAFRIVVEKVAARGGEVIDATIIMHAERTPLNVATTLYRLFEGHAPPPDHWVGRFRPYGIGEDAGESIRACAQDLAHRLQDERLPRSRGWRLINTTPSMLAGIADVSSAARGAVRLAMSLLQGNTRGESPARGRQAAG